MIRYDLQTMDPMQGVVIIEPSGDFTLLYEPITDPLLKRCFEYRRLLLPSPSTAPTVSKILQMIPPLRSLYKALPFAPNLSKPDFVPSKAVLFLERLRTQLPQHRLMVADFDSLPDTVPGRNGPVVQTRVRHEMVPCETFLVKQGYFDIFFPTGKPSPFLSLVFRVAHTLDFELLRDTYSLIMNSPPAALNLPTQPLATRNPIWNDFFTHSVRGFRRRQVGIYGQDEFMRKFGGEEIVGKLTLKDGVSVVDRMYGNAKVMF